VDFVFEGKEIRELEQNPQTKSRWAQIARSGKKVMQFLSEGRHSSVATMLRTHIGARTSGWVFETKKHKPHSASNILKRYLHPILVGDGETPGVTGKKAGEHAFRRYRNSYLRRMSCPVGLLKYWMAHSRKTDMSDVYDKSPEDEAWRLEEAERLGIGFELAENVPSCTDCTEKTKTATELIAV